MPPNSDQTPIKVTAEDLANVKVVEPASAHPPVHQATQGGKSYGTVAEAVEQPAESVPGQSSILLQGWFYLGAAGLLGALAGWAICEPAFVDGQGHRWGNIWMIPLIIALLCLGFGVAESIVERSLQKALVRAVTCLPLGIALGFAFDIGGEIIYQLGVRLCVEAGVQSNRNPAVWVVRGIAWAAFGAAGGVIYGIVGRSSKKMSYGVLGGMLGAGLGGLIFDPISFLTHTGTESRIVGFALLGLATGVAMGLVEGAFKDRWLYVTAGPLAGKQFILYKPLTLIGSDQAGDIYLFKDSSILPRHAQIEVQGARVQLRAEGPVFVSGQPARVQVLQSGAMVQIGRYAFRYQERHRN